MPYQIKPLPKVSIDGTVKVTSDNHDSIIVLSSSPVGELCDLYTDLSFTFLKSWAQKDASITKDLSVMWTDGKPLIISPLGKLDRDYDDVRRYAEAVSKAVKRLNATEACRSPLILVEPPKSTKICEPEKYSRFLEVTMLAALAELDECLEIRETGKAGDVIENLQFVVLGSEGFALVNDSVLSNILAIESGRRLARDIGGSDPERMTALKCADTIQDFFNGCKNISVEVVSKHDVLQKEYPLLMAVARASLHVERHHPCVVRLSYKSPEPSKVEEELFLVGKGVTFDTGGADLKTGGHMVGMSRDKCGAANLAGFMSVVANLSPTNINVTTELAFVRNSIGSNSYVCDEIITSRAGSRVRIGNTDAEGRLAMCDLLAAAKEKALALPDPSKARLMTCATLTGHVVRSYGPYAAAMDNFPAKRAKVGLRIRESGEILADPFELSTIRRDDFDFVAPKSKREDVLQANTTPSTMTSRGHQYPFAFLSIASGLDKHAGDSDKPIAYTHIDIAGAAEEPGMGALGRPTGCPIVALAGAFIFKFSWLK